MSYILDALKKAERERGLAKVPTIDAIHNVPERNRASRWIAAGIISLCVITALCLIFLKIQKTDKKNVASSTLSASSMPPQAIVTSAPVDGSGRLPEKADNKPDVEAPVLPPERSLDNSTPDAAAQAISPPSAGSRSSDRSVLADPVNTPARKGDASSTAIPAQAVSFRDAVALFHMSIHVYADNKEERLVFINGKPCREGDYLEPGIYLEKITPEGAVLRSGAEQVILRPGSR